MRLDPHEAALWAIIAVALVLVGALITPGTLTADQRGPVLAGLVSVLLAIGWRTRHPPGGGS